MREIGAFEAKNTLGTLLDLVQQGEEIVITRHGKPIARLIREDARIDQVAARKAAENIRALAQSIQLGPYDWNEWKRDRDEGRP
ncbi:MAG: type II toxin-antitoxin system Phd/YefM family antitoxin [Beijerinckiaceae bacterium]